MLAEEPGGMGWHATPSLSLFPAVLLQMVLPGGAGAERTQVLRAPGEEPASEEAVCGIRAGLYAVSFHSFMFRFSFPASIGSFLKNCTIIITFNT